MGKSLNGKELGKGITQRPNHAYMARFVDSQGKRRTLYDRNLKRLMLKLEKARYEMTLKEHYKYEVVNDEVLLAVKRIKDIIMNHKEVK